MDAGLLGDVQISSPHPGAFTFVAAFRSSRPQIRHPGQSAKIAQDFGPAEILENFSRVFGRCREIFDDKACIAIRYQKFQDSLQAGHKSSAFEKSFS